METLITKIGKDIFLSLIKQTLKIENEGGLPKKGTTIKMDDKKLVNETERKSPGGVLFYLFKQSNNIVDKNFIKEVFRKDYKNYKERKKIIKMFDQILL